MEIRVFTPADLDEVRRIHEAHFSKEFDLPDFTKYICAFVVEDEQGIITTGGVRDIAECVAVTNLSRNPKDRIKALYNLLDASVFVCKRSEYDQMYVWSQNPKYSRRLTRNGFRPSIGQSLILDL